MLKKVIAYLNLNNIGLLEITVALYLILMGYDYGAIKLSIITPIIMCILAIIRNNGKIYLLRNNLLLVLIIYVAIHQILIGFIIDYLPSYFINNTISIITILLSIFIISPAIDFTKLKGALNLVALFCILGMFYHSIIILSGDAVSPIKLPFLPDLSVNSRLHAIVYRPTSFFWEPASYATFMMPVLWISIIDRKYIWASLIVFSVFLSTSTTGIILSIVLIVVYSFTIKLSFKNVILPLFIAVSIIYAFINFHIFESGLQKLESTDIEETSRIINGPTLVSGMQLEELMFGFKAANVEDYYDNGYRGNNLIETSSGQIFVSSFWLILAQFGLIGLLIYLMLYFRLLTKNRIIIPYVVIILISMFSQSVYIGGMYFWQLLILLSVPIVNNMIKINK